MNAPSLTKRPRTPIALRDYAILDSAPEADFDDIAALAAQICGTPMAMVNLLDADRQWTKAAVGTDIREMPLDQAICPHAVTAGSYLEVPDTTLDPRTALLDICAGPEGVRFYSGAVLTSPEGESLGSLCVLDRVPRKLDDSQEQALRVLARQVVKLMDLRRAIAVQQTLAREVDHRVKNSLQAVISLTRLQRRSAADGAVKQALQVVESRLSAVAALHEELYRTELGGRIELRQYLDTVAGLLRPGLPTGVTLEIEVEELELASQKAGALAVIVNEIVANSLKHAFGQGGPGTIRITGARTDTNEFLLQGRDSGPQTPRVPAEGSGLGLGIIEASSAQLEGQADYGGGAGGFVTRVRFPLD